MTLKWPLPETAFIPGQTPRPKASPAFEAAAAAPLRTEPQHWIKNETYLYGITLYEAGFFWEAHEVWEPVWMRAAPNSRTRALVQGLIQLANACLKIRMSRTGAALRLLETAIGHFREAVPGPLMGLSPEALTNETKRFACLVGLDLAERPRLNTERAL